MTDLKNKIPLIRKTSKTFLRISLVLMFVSTIALYFYVRNLLQEEVEEELRSTEARIEMALSKNRAVFQLPPMVQYEQVSTLELEKLKDTIIFDPSQDEMEEFRELSTYSEINGQNYRITVRALMVESEDILIAVIVSYLIIIFLVFIFLFYFNKTRSQKLWHPFFYNLEQMKQFSLASEKPIELQESEILEFSELNVEITTLTDKVRSDYRNLKQFTEDVSHEMQTPLAIIQAKIENIINGDNLNNNQFEHLTSIQKDIQRLTQLNRRMTLLTKIENQQFVNPEHIILNQVVRKRIDNFNEVYPFGIELIEKNEVEVNIDPYLADILCDNLLSNALKYNGENAAVRVDIYDSSISVSNKGEKKIQNPEKLFSRFYRETSQVKSTGLGLAIVKKICDLNGFKPSYNFTDGRHIFKVNFT